MNYGKIYITKEMLTQLRVPELVKRGYIDLVAAIEVARQFPQNPPIPSELEEAYFQALKQAVMVVPNDQDQLLAFYTVHAALQGQNNLARVLDFISIEEIMNEIN